jgi:Fe2+ transport system protein FeoA
MEQAKTSSKKFKMTGFKMDDSGIQNRLEALGFRIGVCFEIWNQSLFGGGVIILIHNQLVGLRQSEFECLQMEPIYDFNPRG